MGRREGSLGNLVVEEGKGTVIVHLPFSLQTRKELGVLDG